MVPSAMHHLAPALIDRRKCPRRQHRALRVAAAYFTEIVRAGLQSVAAGQRNAGLATGLTQGQVMRLIILPQALRRMTPSLLTQGLIAFQDSTVASVISVPEVMQATTVNQRARAGSNYAVCDSGGDLLRDLLCAEPDDQLDGTRRAIPHGEGRELGPSDPGAVSIQDRVGALPYSGDRHRRHPVAVPRQANQRIGIDPAF
jgi:hypothetical protein